MTMTPQLIESKIHEIRGMKVMLDRDLAALYEVPTKVFNQAVKRNEHRFPFDFRFQLNKEEFETLRSHFVTSNKGGRRYLPYAFTEQGVAMLSSVLNSETAIAVNIAVIRTFAQMRRFAMGYQELKDYLQQLEGRYDDNFKEIYQALNLLLAQKTSEADFNSQERIGYKL